MTSLVNFERRRFSRPDAPLPAKLVYLRLLTDRVAKNIFSSPIRTAMFVGLQLLSVALILWSLAYRLPDTDGSRILQQQVQTLRDEYSALKSGWSEQQLADIEDNLMREQARVFEDFPSLAAWLSRKTQLASRLGMSMHYAIQQQQETRLKDTLILPVRIGLKINAPSSDKTYASVLEFIHSLIDENLHLEVKGNTVKSDGDSITEVSLSVNIWVHDQQGMAATGQRTGVAELAEMTDETYTR